MSLTPIKISEETVCWMNSILNLLYSFGKRHHNNQKKKGCPQRQPLTRLNRASADTSIHEETPQYHCLLSLY